MDLTMASLSVVRRRYASCVSGFISIESCSPESRRLAVTDPSSEGWSSILSTCVGTATELVVWEPAEALAKAC